MVSGKYDCDFQAFLEIQNTMRRLRPPDIHPGSHDDDI